jgi:N-acetylmuramoyl-L-alanine amidase
MIPFDPDTPLVGAVRASPNSGERKDGRQPDIILLHYTGMAEAEAAVALLCDPASGVSCHYVVHEDGRIVQLVPEDLRAWHAGAGSWKGETDVNSASIGIEIVNRGHDFDYPDFPDAQIEALIALCHDIAARRGVPAERVLAHSDTAPRRKIDPGEKFPWERLHRAGVGHWVSPAPLGDGRCLTLGESGEPVAALQALLALYGYGVAVSGVFDEDTRFVVQAFQRHFRPALVDGVADASTVTTLRDLLRALPALS